MKAQAIEKATRRLREAGQHLATVQSLAGTLNVPGFQDAWSKFLVALNSVPEILRTGARSSPQSKQWYGSKDKTIIGRDPLLQYLKQARGADYHGLQDVSTAAMGESPYIGAGPAFGYTIQTKDGRSVQIGPAATVGFAGNPFAKGPAKFTFKLCSVADERHATVFEIPSAHLGQLLADRSPYAIGELGLKFYETLIAEASALI